MQVACCHDATFALAEDGQLYSFGDSSLGQLGHLRNDSEQSTADGWRIRDQHAAPMKFSEVCGIQSASSQPVWHDFFDMVLPVL